MAQQQYSNHVRYYPPHHFVFYPLVLVLIVLTTRQAFHDTSNRCLWAVIAILLLLLGWLSFMMRQHYSLTGQNRIIRLEMRFRYYVLTGKRFELLEKRLSFKQVAALRFASDAELPSLVQQAVDANLSPSQIKKAIQNWEPDHMRV